jgi:predicted secreted protein with PEFG-CTERM motif
MEYKAYALMAILLTSVGAIGTLGAAYAQTGLTVATDKTDYTTGDEIKISGNVGTVTAGQPVLLRVDNPNGAVYRIDQIPAADVGADGAYSYTLKVGGKIGISGEYIVKVTYNGVTRETTFNFTSTEPNGGNTGGWKTAKMVITASDGSTAEHDIKYKISGGTLDNLTGVQDDATLTAMITATADGQLTLQLPRDVIDSKNGTDDSDYVVFVDEVEDFADDDRGANIRTVTINFSEGAEQIDVVGTFMVPEFGAIAAIVLAVAIVGIIVATTRYSKFSFFPKM